MRTGMAMSVLSRFSAGLVLALTAFAGTVDEYQLKAAFLYSFAKFVEWPPASFKTGKDPIRICVIGEDPFGGSLDEVLKGKTVLGRPIELSGIPGAAQAADCQIAFVSSSEQKHLRAIMKYLPASGILTVGETDGFAQHGGMINLTRENGRIRFEINAELASAAGLRISSRVLELARIVKSEPDDPHAH
jgi:hypothetical protein